jgi:isopenicillin N synthase-like dioxygenase
VRYLTAVKSLSYEFVRLVAEALGLAPDGLARFYDAPEHMQHRSKVRPPTSAAQKGYADRPATRRLPASFIQIVKYPTRDQVASEQGVGPHFDAGFLTFVSPPTASFEKKIRCRLLFSRRARRAHP